MKNLINICVIVTLIFCTATVHAAFPVHTVAESNMPVVTEKISFEEFIQSTIEKYKLPVPPVRETAGEDGAFLNILSLSLGAAGILAILAATLIPAAGWVLFAASVGLGVAAIVTGGMGMGRRPLRGLGIAGFALGMAPLAILLVAAVVMLILLLLFGQV